MELQRPAPGIEHQEATEQSMRLVLDDGQKANGKRRGLGPTPHDPSVQSEPASKVADTQAAVCRRQSWADS
jgi:hypothetical protein